MARTFLSKTSFIKGLQCHKQLWLYKHRPELRDPIDPGLQALFDTGHRVGELATQLFPGGRMLPCEELSVLDQVATTRAWLEQGVTTIYEAAFLVNGLFARVDILHQGPAGWELYEVKNSAKVREVYIQDVAVQTRVVKQAGLSLSKACLVTLRKPYRSLDAYAAPQFVMHDLTRSVNLQQEFVRTEVNRMQAMLQKGEYPQVLVGPQCNRPYRCNFYRHCHARSAVESGQRETS